MLSNHGTCHGESHHVESFKTQPLNHKEINCKRWTRSSAACTSKKSAVAVLVPPAKDLLSMLQVSGLKSWAQTHTCCMILQTFTTQTGVRNLLSFLCVDSRAGKRKKFKAAGCAACCKFHENITLLSFAVQEPEPLGAAPYFQACISYCFAWCLRRCPLKKRL